MLQGQSIICFGGEDLWYHHPHPSEHLLRRFARAGNPVIFVNSISMGMPSLAHKDILPRVVRKLRSYARFAREYAENITAVSPPTIPLYGTRVARWANRRLLAAQVGGLARRRGMKHPILWLAIPTASDTIGQFGESLVIYIVSDKYDANTMDHATDPAHIRRLHEHALDHADLIFYTGRKLLDEATGARERSYLLEHGVDYALFAQVADKHIEVAPEIERIPHPRLGYFGATESWLIDQELVRRAAAERPAWQWVFIGNHAQGLEMGHWPNVHLLPAVPYQELPRYAAGFDVCVLPWDAAHPWTRYTSPMKVREYLATGKPTVISRLYEFEHLRDVVRMADGHEEFLREVDTAIADTSDDARRARQAAVADVTWDKHAEWISTLIETKLAEKQQRRAGESS